MLPKAMEDVAKGVAEVAWKEMKKTFDVKALEKSKFVRETVSNYKKDPGQKKNDSEANRCRTEGRKGEEN